jgi:hypothetical protein
LFLTDIVSTERGPVENSSSSVFSCTTTKPNRTEFSNDYLWKYELSMFKCPYNI